MQPSATRLADYQPPAFLIDEVQLHFDLAPEKTEVQSRLSIRANPAAAREDDLVLDGVSLETLRVTLDGEELTGNRIRITDETLTLHDVPDSFILETAVVIRPGANTSLEGLYASSGNLCTQCEAEGFRKITWFLDRPDVMSKYRTTLSADCSAFPVLLSNGNPVASGNSPDGRHYVTWEDPFPKPAYLFALVAGQLACVEDRFETRSGRDICLQIFVQPHNADRCDHAMESLKKSMRWDEDVYGLEYDLDRFMIVAVDDFNMGAMENKGLNVFNSKYVLARPDTATDQDFAGIEGVIAHEYFHNWTGNRVTCRDWFQLSLKEGLTVFRDQQFSADMGSPAVKRIQDVRVLRTHQFAEDGGPMAHPVRPDAYIEISNFYTVTIYNKGAELIRMMHTLLGRERFHAGMRLYFERHDGEAVTTDDFVAAMSDASGVDLTQFQRWYAQAGTPLVTVSERHDAAQGSYVLQFNQVCPPTPGQVDKAPMHIPVRLGLLGPDGSDLALTPSGETELLVELRETHTEVRFENMPTRPVASIARGFSAPIRIEFDRDDEDLAFLLANDSDAFNRWDSGQTYSTKLLLSLVADVRREKELVLPERFAEAIRALLLDESLDAAFVAEAISLPSESYLADQSEAIDVDAIHEARDTVRRTLAFRHEDVFAYLYRSLASDESYRFEPRAAGRRSLRNAALGYLMELAEPDLRAACIDQLDNADNMTDSIAALACLANDDCDEREDALARFYGRWRDDPLVLDKWFFIQATSRLPDTLDNVRTLMSHPAFDLSNPNKVRSLVGAFCHANQVRFNDATGAGYRFLADCVLEIDALNPQIAARLLGAASRWRRLDPERRTRFKTELDRVLAAPGLSKDSYEIVSKTLG